MCVRVCVMGIAYPGLQGICCLAGDRACSGFAWFRHGSYAGVRVVGPDVLAKWCCGSQAGLRGATELVGMPVGRGKSVPVKCKVVVGSERGGCFDLLSARF